MANEAIEPEVSIPPTISDVQLLMMVDNEARKATKAIVATLQGSPLNPPPQDVVMGQMLTAILHNQLAVKILLAELFVALGLVTREGSHGDQSYSSDDPR